MSELRDRKKIKKEDTPKGTDSSTEQTPQDKKKSVQSNTQGFIARFIAYLFEPEDASNLGIFRIFWGITMMYEMYTLVADNFLVLVLRYYLNPYNFQFKYYPFDWVELIPFPMMLIVVLVLSISAFCITIGLWFKFFAKIFFFGITYLFLLDAANYLNHMYLVCVISGVIMFMPCSNSFALFSSCKANETKTVPR